MNSKLYESAISYEMRQKNGLQVMRCVEGVDRTNALQVHGLSKPAACSQSPEKWIHNSLVDLLSDNPLHCDSCRKEVDPERLGLSAEEVEDVAAWFSAARALYRLWLHSGEYEEYAKARLLDPNGQVNRDGLAVARKLSARLPTRLWYFSDTGEGEPTHCPICRDPLDPNVRWGTGMCVHFGIQM